LPSTYPAPISVAVPAVMGAAAIVVSATTNENAVRMIEMRFIQFLSCWVVMSRVVTFFDYKSNVIYDSIIADLTYVSYA
jgi:hypothetical protein